MWQTLLEIATVIGGLVGVIQLIKWGREFMSEQGLTAKACLEFLVLMGNSYLLAIPTTAVFIALPAGLYRIGLLIWHWLFGSGLGKLSFAPPLQGIEQLLAWCQEYPWLTMLVYFGASLRVMDLHTKDDNVLRNAADLFFVPLLLDAAGVLAYFAVGGVAWLVGYEIVSWTGALNVGIFVHYLTWTWIIWPDED